MSPLILAVAAALLGALLIYAAVANLSVSGLIVGQREPA